jgi:hypothetical protein
MDSPTKRLGPPAGPLYRRRCPAAQFLFLGLATFFFSVSGLSASGWSTDYFNTNSGWIRNDALAYEVPGEPETGQNYNAAVADQWYTDDPFNVVLSNGATSVLKHFDGWSLGTAQQGHNSVLFGGYGLQSDILPGTAAPSLYRSFSAFEPDETPIFVADFGIITSSPSYPNKDRFGFNLLDATGTVSLAQFIFDPAASAFGPGALGMQWISGSSTNDIADISYGALYRIIVALNDDEFDLTMASIIAQTNSVGVVTNYATTNAVSLVAGGAIANGLTATDFQTIAMNWELVEGQSDPGDNYILVNNVSVVPEPSTYALLAISALGALYWARRRHCR